MSKPGGARGRRGGGRAVADRPADRPPRKPERTPPRPVSKVRYRRRRLAALLAAVLLLVGLGLTARVLLYDAGLFDVEDVQVTGAVTVPEAEVLDAAAVTLGGPLAAVDTEAVASRIAQLPAVESVRADRSWPHTVTVAITERVPVATVATPRGPALVDRFAVVHPGEPVAGLPRLTGVSRTGDPAAVAAVAVLTALPEEVRAEVETVRATVSVPGAPGQVTLGISGGREVRWGTPDRLAEKVTALTVLLTQPGRVYDVTSPDLPTIRR
jgi:cell division protein FtsQ